MLTGRNHHSNAMACITEGATGYPGSNGLIPFENGFLSEILQPQGYNTFAIGKWHLTPTEQCSAAGPYDRWPLGRGFERFYGFMGGDTHQYYPDLVYDNHQVKPPRTPEQGYHLTEDLVDHAIEFIADAKQVAPEKPFFMYFCPGAMHAPHQVPREWADRYKGQFDGGWDRYREAVFERQLKMGVVPPGTLYAVLPGNQTWGYPKYSINFTNVYEFSSGYLRGFKLGGTAAANWRNVAMYYYPNGFTGANFSDQRKFQLPMLSRFDLIAGYSRKFGRFRWSTQLNISNLFNHYHIVIYPNATTGYSNVPSLTANLDQQPRFLSWTNTIGF